MRVGRILPCVLLSWFFLLENISLGTHTMIGPFDTEKECYGVQEWIKTGPLGKGQRRYTACWNATK